MNIIRSFVIAFALGAIVFVFSTAAAFGQAETTHTQFSLYGMHFIRGGQTVGIIIHYPRLNDREVIPCVKVRIVFDIYEEHPPDPGRLRFARRVSREVLLDGGEAATFEFPAGRTGDWVSPMVFARPEGVPPIDPDRERVLPTLVVREFGRTILNLPAVLKGFDPQPDPPAERAQ